MKNRLFILFVLPLLFACKTPSETAVTTETENLSKNMKSLALRGCMIGHQDDLPYGVTWEYEPGRSDHKDVTGDYPAVFGWDLGKLENGSPLNIDGVPFDMMKRFITDVYDKGGINTISWHADNPETGGDAWDVSSNQTVKSLLKGEANHDKFKTMLDKFVEFNSTLVGSDGKKIPIIFRPYHELTGSWFWWGRNLCTSDEFKQLWIFTHKYLTETKGQNNLLFAYSASSDYATEEEFTDRYPGDEYVDIVGFDVYQSSEDFDGEQRFIETASRCMKIASEVAAKRNKVFALTEAGFAALPDSTWFTRVLYPLVTDNNCSYVLFWRNANEKRIKDHFFIPYEGHASAEDFVNFVGDEKIFTLKNINKMYVIPIP